MLRHSVVSDSFQPHGLKPTKLLCPWDSPGLSFPTSGDLPNPEIEPMFLCLLHWQVGSLPPAPPGKPLWNPGLTIIFLGTLKILLYCHLGSTVADGKSDYQPNYASFTTHPLVFLFLDILQLYFKILDCKFNFVYSVQFLRMLSVWRITPSILDYFVFQ